MIRLLCVTVYVFNSTGSHTLFINHRKLQKWMPPGGKVDPNELPDVAAVRECFEETGAHVTLVGERFPFESSLIRPFGTQLNTVVPGERQHIDLVYAAVADMQQPLIAHERETSGVMWMPVSDVISPNYNTFAENKYWVKRLSAEMPALLALPLRENKEKHVTTPLL